MKTNLYKNYLSTHFQEIHQNDYSLMSKYYAKNYFKFLGKKTNKILDLGCGMGHFLYFLKQKGYNNYTGIDVSPECISFCKKQGLGKSENLLVANLFYFLKKDKQKFNVIILNDVIEHIEKEKIILALSLIKKSLKKNGKLVIKTLNSSNPITGSSSRYLDFTHAVGFTEESLKQILKTAGFKKVKLYPQDIFVFNPIVNLIGKTLQIILNLLFRIIFLIYGRKTTTIFTKDIIALAEN